MQPSDSRFDRPDPRDAVRRDERRMARRSPDGRDFWKSIRVLGMVGWPIALGSVGGTLLGRWFDVLFQTGIRFTLMLMTIGVMVGCFAAWISVKGEG